MLLLLLGCVVEEVACRPDLSAEECPMGRAACERCSSATDVWYECGGWSSAVVPTEDAVDAELDRLCHCYQEPGEACEAPTWFAG